MSMRRNDGSARKSEESQMQVNCVKCDRPVDVPCTEQQIKVWQDGEMIQNAMPNLTADQREMLITGICGICWEVMFGQDGSIE